VLPRLPELESKEEIILKCLKNFLQGSDHNVVQAHCAVLLEMCPFHQQMDENQQV